MVRRLLITAVALVVGAAVSVPAASAQEASGYRFRQIVDVADGFDFFGFGCPAINNDGESAFNVVGSETGAEQIVRARNRKLRTIVDRDGAGLAQLFRSPSINDRGQVAFGATRTDDSEVMFVGKGGKLTTIAETEPGPFSRLFAAEINNNGQVAFDAELDDGDSGIFVGDGGDVTTIYTGDTSPFRGFNSAAAINDTGQIAFADALDDGTNGLFLFDDGVFTTVADDTGPFRDFGGPDLNNAGVLSFTATLDTVEAGVFTAGGGAITEVAGTAGPYSFFFGTVVNNAGTVAFEGFLDDGGSGIFTGPDPVADKVVALGDTILGEMVISVQLCAEGLNDNGEIVFLGTLIDGRSGVFTATPIRTRG